MISEHLPELVLLDKAGEHIGSELRLGDLFEAGESEKVRSWVFPLFEKNLCLAEQGPMHDCMQSYTTQGIAASLDYSYALLERLQHDYD